MVLPGQARPLGHPGHHKAGFAGRRQWIFIPEHESRRGQRERWRSGGKRIETQSPILAQRTGAGGRRGREERGGEVSQGKRASSLP